jgi:L-rhamnose mutarotase
MMPEDRRMQRIGRTAWVKPGREAEYRDWHAKVWPELLAVVREAGIRNYTIFMQGRQLFSYLEVDDFETASAAVAATEVSARWQELMAPFMDAVDEISPWTRLDEVFHSD